MLVSNTVGLIKNLPHGLVESFKSTLEKALDASLPLHVSDVAAQAEREAALRADYPGCIAMSARRPDDVARQHQAIVAFFQKDLVETGFFLPWSAQQLRGEIFARCEVLEERADVEDAFFRVRGKQEALDSLREKFSQAG